MHIAYRIRCKNKAIRAFGKILYDNVYHSDQASDAVIDLELSAADARRVAQAIAGEPMRMYLRKLGVDWHVSDGHALVYLVASNGDDLLAFRAAQAMGYSARVPTEAEHVAERDGRSLAIVNVPHDRFDEFIDRVARQDLFIFHTLEGAQLFVSGQNENHEETLMHAMRELRGTR